MPTLGLEAKEGNEDVSLNRPLHLKDYRIPQKGSVNMHALSIKVPCKSATNSVLNLTCLLAHREVFLTKFTLHRFSLPLLTYLEGSLLPTTISPGHTVATQTT